jgi:hypothetical protein
MRAGGLASVATVYGSAAAEVLPTDKEAGKWCAPCGIPNRACRLVFMALVNGDAAIGVLHGAGRWFGTAGDR